MLNYQRRAEDDVKPVENNSEIVAINWLAIGNWEREEKWKIIISENEKCMQSTEI